MNHVFDVSAGRRGVARREGHATRRRDEVVGIFPAAREAFTRVVGAVPAQQHDEWPETRRYPGVDFLSRRRFDPVRATSPGEVTRAGIAA